MAAEAGGPTEEPQPAPLAEQAGEAEDAGQPELPEGADEYVAGADGAQVPRAEQTAEAGARGEDSAAG